MKPSYVYVASSWRNPIQIAVVAALRSAQIECYDFRNPEPGEIGFNWKDVMPTFRGANDQAVPVDEYLAGINHPTAMAGYGRDLAAMKRADAVVCVLPCGRSAHLELGWAAGMGKRTAVLLDDPVTPELMYRMCEYLAPSLFDLLGWLGVED